ncbi:MAG: rod shape-determining protein MreC [Magnetococcales bacterium]|nr:rod shape-determining protein MreC [Magnetococcales bacterium]
MDYFLVLVKEHRNVIIAVATLLLSVLLLLALRPGVRGTPELVEDVALDAVGNVQSLIQIPITYYQDFAARFVQWQNLDEENRRLSQELKLLRPLGARVVELEAENHRLRQLLDMSLDPELKSLGARVVGDTSTAFANVLLLNAGRNQGSATNASVLVPEGVVGRVVQTSNTTSLVLTLLDLNSRVPALVQRTRARGIVAGVNGQKLSLEYIGKDEDIRVGDQVITSGIAGSFPKGLLIGTVQEIREGDTGLFQRVIVQPSVDFDRIEEVRLLIPGPQSAIIDSSKNLNVIKRP